MYISLDKAIDEKRINKNDIAKLIDKTYGTVLQKINGNYPFTLDEALLIHGKYFPEYDFTYLFNKADTETQGTA